MKKKSFIKILSISFLTISLSSCAITDAISSYLNVITENTDKTSIEDGSVSIIEHGDSGNSLELLNSAFNSHNNRRDFSNLQDAVIETSSTHKKYDTTQNIQNLDYFEGLTPNNGKIKGLVLPIDFKDNKVSTKTYRNIEPEWYSISDFYYNSSYGKLDLTFDIMDWYTVSKNASYYERLKTGFEGDAPGVSAIIKEALNYYSKILDLTEYDSNNDGMIDALYVIYNHPIDWDNGDFWWAYQYYYLDDDYFDGVSPYPYFFASFDFLFGDYGNMHCDTHTFIHETGHLLGLEDYYDYDDSKGKNSGGLGGNDLMDYTIGDHNAFSKMELGWMDPIIIDNGIEATIKLPSIEVSNKCIILTNNYNETKGMFQEYFVIEYYTPTFLHEYDKMFTEKGVRIYRVNAETENVDENGYTYTKLKYDNSYTKYNLIDAIINSSGGIYSSSNYSQNPASNSDLFIKNELLQNAKYNNNSVLNYVVSIDDIDDTYATITITSK